MVLRTGIFTQKTVWPISPNQPKFASEDLAGLHTGYQPRPRRTELCFAWHQALGILTEASIVDFGYNDPAVYGAERLQLQGPFLSGLLTLFIWCLSN
jgi:hypothetical protein